MRRFLWAALLASLFAAGYFHFLTLQDLIDRANAQVGGWAHPARLNALTNTVTQVIPGANVNVSRGGSLVMLHCNNPNGNVAYVQLFDSATNTNVTLGTTTPTLSFAMPPSTASGYALAVSGIGFGTGLFAATTTTATGSTAPTTALDCNAAYL